MAAMKNLIRRASTFLPRDVVIVGVARTAVGGFQSTFASLPATRLGSIAIKGALQRANVAPGDVQEVYMGNVISAGLGQSPARQALIEAGLPTSTEATTINKVCASGMKAVMLAAQSIALGHRDIMVAGGMESMSNVPYIMRTARQGAGYGHQTIEDLILGDGLTDVYNKFHMGMCGENTAAKYKISREEQDAYAIESYDRAAKAATTRLAKEIVPVQVPQKKGDPITVTVDEQFKNINKARVPQLKPVFKKDGTITAANASTLNDAAAAVVLMSREAAEKKGLKPLAVIRGFADAALDPIDFPTAPALAVPLALKAAGVSKDDISSWEINEAFAVVVLANMKLLGIPHSKVNMYGGAVSLGHPIGMSGARLVVSLTTQLEKGQLGCASICNGGGAASAIVIEKL